MKSFIVVSLFLTSYASVAGTVRILEFKETFDKKVHEINFQVNKSLKRAWVKVTLGETFSDEIYFDEFSIAVSGLSYSPELNGVVYDDGTETILCDTFYNRRWYPDGGMSFHESGRCKFEMKRIVKELDDGFNIRKVKMVEVVLKIK